MALWCARQAMLQTSAEALRVQARLAVEVRPRSAQTRIQPRPLKQHPPQLQRKVPGALVPQQQMARHVFVHLRLQLQFQ